MVIKIEFIGFPIIYDLFPEGFHPYTFEGKTLSQLITGLIARDGGRVQEALLDPGTRNLDPTIQIRINGKFVLKEEISAQEIEEDDQVTFFKLLAGG
jgi:sulfur carrier protein ThiS